MPNEELIILKKSEAEDFFLRCLQKHEENKRREADMSSFTINQVAKKLHRHHSTIKKLVKTGQLYATSDGRIPTIELNRYMAGQTKI